MAAASDDAGLVEHLTSTLRATTPAERKSIRALDSMLRKADTGHDIGDALARVSRAPAVAQNPDRATGVEIPARADQSRGRVPRLPARDANH